MILGDDVKKTICSFDFDFVSCAILKDFEVVRTEECQLALQTGKIQHILNFAYNPTRFLSRLRKASRKGFFAPSCYQRLSDFPLPFYKPRHLSQEQFKYEISQFVPHHLERSEIERDLVPRKSQIFTNLEDALEEQLVNFTRENYEGFGDLEGGIMKHPSYLFLKSFINERDPKSRLLHLIETLKSREDRESFYLCRSLELLNQGNYDEAVRSALSDSNKLGSNDSTFLFGQGMEMLMYYQSQKTYNDALWTIKRLFHNQELREL